MQRCAVKKGGLPSIPLLAEEVEMLMATERGQVTYGKAWVAMGR